MLAPVFALGCWTVVMFAWMIATRIPAMQKAGIDAQEAQTTSKLVGMLPHDVIKVSNNYNHLFEQPTLFYAIAIAIAVAGIADSFFVTCAWAFVALRVVHSLVQATIDVVMVRFGLFALSWLVLAAMSIRGLLILA